MSGWLDGLLVVVTGAVLVALRHWPLHGWAACVIIPI